MKPSALLDDSKVVLNIDSSAPKAEVMRRLVETAVGNEADAAPILEDLLAREAKMTTGIGQGIAIPHTRSPILGKAVAALGISQAGIDFEAVDEEPVHIIFAFITPSSEPGLHMQTLAAIASLFSDAGVREAMRRVSSPAEAINIMRSHGA